MISVHKFETITQFTRDGIICTVFKYYVTYRWLIKVSGVAIRSRDASSQLCSFWSWWIWQNLLSVGNSRRKIWCRLKIKTIIRDSGIEKKLSKLIISLFGALRSSPSNDSPYATPLMLIEHVHLQKNLSCILFLCHLLCARRRKGKILNIPNEYQKYFLTRSL